MAPDLLISGETGHEEKAIMVKDKFTPPSAALPMRPKRLGELLIEANVIQPKQLAVALNEQNRLNGSSKRKFKLGEILLFLNYIKLGNLHATLKSQRPRSLEDTNKLKNLRAINARPLDRWLKKFSR